MTPERQVTNNVKSKKQHKKSPIMKKAIVTIGLFSLVMILTSFTTPETNNLNIVGQGSTRGNMKLDIVGQGSTRGNMKLDIVGQGSTRGNMKLDIVGQGSTRGNMKLD
jgi:hypothetical protein